MSANARRFTLIMLCVLVLAGCGGGTSGNSTPEATAEPTLTLDERANFSPGSIENPLRVMIRPVSRVFTELQTLLAGLSGTTPADISGDMLLRSDFDLPDNLAALTTPISTTFAVSLTPADVASVQTVADLSNAIERKLGQQVSQTLYNRTGIYFEVVPVASYGDGLDAVCESTRGVVSVAWLDGITSLSAVMGDCGDFDLKVGTFGEAYDVRLLQDMPLDFVVSAVSVDSEATAEATAEATPDEGSEETPIPTETATPTEEPTATPTEEPQLEATPEATAEFEANSLSDTFRFGTPVFLIFNRGLGTTSIDAIRNRTFCRLGYDDFYSWLVPSLVLRRNNIEPQDIEFIEDYPTEAQLVRAVAAGVCTSAALSEDTYESLTDILPQSVWDEIRFGDATPVFPYAVLVYPTTFQRDVRLQLNEVFESLSTDDTAGASLRWLLGSDVVVPVTDADFSDFIAFLQSTGFNFAQLDN